MSERIKLLYVDDEPTNLILFEHNFNKHFDIITAESGKQGLEILKKNPQTKVVISDMRMPEMSGLEFIKTAKGEFPTKKYYILTGYEITPDISEAIKGNIVTNCFSKPFNKQEIEDSIAESLN
ncbi:MAG: response regulator [Marinilabiliales bacterium]|nr:MAG: response regulator [Marinilabiliales bacterium]